MCAYFPETFTSIALGASLVIKPWAWESKHLRIVFIKIPVDHKPANPEHDWCEKAEFETDKQANNNDKQANNNDKQANNNDKQANNNDTSREKTEKNKENELVRQDHLMAKPVLRKYWMRLYGPIESEYDQTIYILNGVLL